MRTLALMRGKLGSFNITGLTRPSFFDELNFLSTVAVAKACFMQDI